LHVVQVEVEVGPEGGAEPPFDKTAELKGGGGRGMRREAAGSGMIMRMQLHFELIKMMRVRRVKTGFNIGEREIRLANKNGGASAAA